MNYCSLWLWNKFCWFLNCSLYISLINEFSNTSSEQAKITRNIPIKIAQNLPKSLFTQKLLVTIIQHNAITLSVGCSTVTDQNDGLSQPHKSEDVDATVWLRCQSSAGPRVPIPQWYAVTTRPQFGFSCCELAAEERPIFYNRLGWGLDYLEAKVSVGWSPVSHAWADRPSPLHGEHWAGAPSCWRHHLQRIFNM